MNTDTFFTQGSSHRICQDYAAHGPNYVVLSDGCSSATDSDFGARLLTRAAISAIRDYKIFDAKTFYNTILTTAAIYCDALKLSSDALFATLLTARIDPTTPNGENIRVYVSGDGVVAAKRRDGKINVYKISFPGSAPLYLRYFLKKEDWDSFHAQYNGQMSEESYILQPDGEITDYQKVTSEWPHADQLNIYPSYSFNRDDFECIAVFSDGVASFQRFVTAGAGRSTELVPEEEIIKEILAFRGYQGEFVQRRCQMAFNKFEKAGWRNFDDFSVGAIYIGEKI